MSELTATQREKNAIKRVTITVGSQKGQLWGKRGTLEYFGFTVDEQTGDLTEQYITYTANRPTSKRSRWLGDLVGVTIPGNTANVVKYL